MPALIDYRALERSSFPTRRLDDGLAGALAAATLRLYGTKETYPVRALDDLWRRAGGDPSVAMLPGAIAAMVVATDGDALVFRVDPLQASFLIERHRDQPVVAAMASLAA